MKTKVTLLSNMLNKTAGASKKKGTMNLNFGFIDPSSDHTSEFIFTMTWNHKTDKIELTRDEKTGINNKSEEKTRIKNVLWQVAFFPHGLHRMWEQLEQQKKDAIKSKGKVMLAILYLLANAFSICDGLAFDVPAL